MAADCSETHGALAELVERLPSSSLQSCLQSCCCQAGRALLEAPPRRISDNVHIQAAYATAVVLEGRLHLEALWEIIGVFGLPFYEDLQTTTLGPDPMVHLHYIESRLLGTSHKLAEMFALKQSPDIRTDNTLFAGNCCGSQFEKLPWLGDMYAEEARAAGVSITGKVYKSALATYPGDPRAWVSDSHDMIRVAEENGQALRLHHRMATRAAEQTTDDVDEDLDPDIIDQWVMCQFDKHDGLEEECLANPKKLQELRELARTSLKPHWAK